MQQNNQTPQRGIGSARTNYRRRRRRPADHKKNRRWHQQIDGVGAEEL